jgi:RHS repeat-associated protein
VYDSFGNIAASTGSLANPFQYTGRDYDPETGLRYYRARYYDSNVGRFISEDPIRFGGGSADFYSYAYNSPILYGDPLGLAPCSAAQISDCKNKCAADGGQVMDSCSTFNINLLFVSFPVTVCHCKGRFGTCSGIRWATLQGAVDSTCKTGASSACNPTQTCTELKANFALNTACAAARTCLNNECYNGGDAGHQQAAANASRAAAKCAALIAAKRCP